MRGCRTVSKSWRPALVAVQVVIADGLRCHIPLQLKILYVYVPVAIKETVIWYESRYRVIMDAEKHSFQGAERQLLGKHVSITKQASNYFTVFLEPVVTNA